MTNEMDVQRLIDEVRIRPALWDIRNADNTSRSSVPKLWREVANVLGVDDVEQCKRKWKNLRDAYRALVRSSERRMQKDILTGTYDPNRDYDSKWAYFQSLSFIKDNKRRRRRYSDDYNQNTNSNDDVIVRPPSYNGDNVKVEPSHSGDDENQSMDDDNDYDDMADDMLFEEFQSITTPQVLPVQLPAATTLTMIALGPGNNPSTPADKPTPAANAADAKEDCKCSSARSVKHVHFLENLVQEERKLIQSTQQDIKQSTDHIGDSDYNFLVSFLPQMKKMADLQNLQFRARMSDMVLNILGPTIAVYNAPVPPPLTAAPVMAQLQCRDTPAQQQGSEDVTINAATSTSWNFRP